MNAETEQSGIQKTLGIAAFIVALVIALVGISNSSPSFWIIPKMGPYPSAVIRPLILGGAVFLVLVRYPVGPWLLRGLPSLKPAAWVVDVIVMAAALWVFWRYYTDVSEIEFGLFDFTIIHPAIALTACAVFILLVLAGLGCPARGGRDVGHLLFLHRRTLAVDLRDRPRVLHRLVGRPVLQPQ